MISRHIALALGVACWLGIVVNAQQGTAPAAVQTSEQVFKNIQVLKGIP